MSSVNGANFLSTGMRAAQMFEQLNLPGSVSSALGAQIDAALGDVKGAFHNLVDMFSKGMTDNFGKLFGSALPPPQFAHRPMDHIHHAHRHGGHGFSKLGGISRESPFGTGGVGRSIERAIKHDPMFKSMMERALGGAIIPDGRNDGKLTVYRPNSPMIGKDLKHMMERGLLAPMGLAHALAHAGIPFAPPSPVKNALGRLAGNLASFAEGLEAGLKRALEGQQKSTTGAGSSSAAGGTSNASTPSGVDGAKSSAASGLDQGDAAFAEGMGINLANASFEDVLFVLLMKYAKKKEDDIMKKVKELDKSMQSKGEEGGGGGGGGKGGGSGGGGGGSVGGGGGSVGGGGGSLGAVGGSLGAAGGSLGAVAGLAGNVAQMVGGAGGPGGAGGGGGAEKAGGGGGGGGGGMSGANLGEKMDPSQMSDTMKQQMLQKLMGDLQKLYEMLSNMIKSMHDMQMTPVRNLRS